MSWLLGNLAQPYEMPRAQLQLGLQGHPFCLQSTLDKELASVFESHLGQGNGGPCRMKMEGPLDVTQASHVTA